MDKKIYKVNFYSSAYKDLEEIKNYWEKMLKTSASKFMAEIYSKAKTLEEFPFAHHQPNDKVLNYFCP